ncbi:MAG: hypothetical protein RJB26_271 [Pseudomonadota bacterium]|jgi:hypothetical protein
MQATLSPLFAHGRPNVRPDEVQTALGLSRAQVVALEEQGLLQAFGIGDAASREREHLRFTRASVEGFFAFRLAQRGQPLLFDLSPEAARWRDHLASLSRPSKPANPKTP